MNPFNFLSNSENFGKICELFLHKTMLNENILPILDKIENLETLTIESKNMDQIVIAREYKKRHARVSVVFNKILENTFREEVPLF